MAICISSKMYETDLGTIIVYFLVGFDAIIMILCIPITVAILKAF